MPDDVKVPGAGRVNKKKLLIGAAIGLAGVGIYLYIRRRNQAAQAGTTTGTAGTAGTAGSGYDPNLDPATGFDYGTPQDQAALAAQGGGGGWFGGSGGFSSTMPTGTTTPPPAPAPTQTETQWISQASSDLSRFGGVSRMAAAEALTEWIAGQQITAQQAQYVREAMALDGNPPNGAPPIHQKPSGTQDHDVAVPAVTGEPLRAAGAKVRAAGLKPQHQGDQARELVRAQHPDSGRLVERGSVVTLVT